ncbi:MAG: NAD(P)/FAD-dependent oxidoreductase, partial [Casimicrobiaceae bacterium]
EVEQQALKARMLVQQQGAGLLDREQVVVADGPQRRHLLHPLAQRPLGGVGRAQLVEVDLYRVHLEPRELRLAGAAAARGAQLFERTPVKTITFTRKHAFVTLAGGAIKTRRVIVATGGPTTLFRALQRHFWFRSTYLVLTAPVPVKIRRQLGLRRAVLRDMAAPPHIIRWLNDERLLVNGADAEAIPAAQRDKILVQRTGQLMYELSTLYPDISGIRPEYGWDAPYARTADGLPYIGAHRNYPHHLFAFGDSSHSATGAYLASRIFLRQHLGEPESADEVFGFHR